MPAGPSPLGRRCSEPLVSLHVAGEIEVNLKVGLESAVITDARDWIPQQVLPHDPGYLRITRRFAYHPWSGQQQNNATVG